MFFLIMVMFKGHRSKTFTAVALQILVIKSGVRGPAVAAAPGNWLERQNLIPLPRSNESEATF